MCVIKNESKKDNICPQGLSVPFIYFFVLTQYYQACFIMLILRDRTRSFTLDYDA